MFSQLKQVREARLFAKKEILRKKKEFAKKVTKLASKLK